MEAQSVSASGGPKKGELVGQFSDKTMNLHALTTSPAVAVSDVMMAAIFLSYAYDSLRTSKMLKKLFFPLVALFMLAGCATPP